MPRNSSTVMRRQKFTRRLVGDSTIDRALKDVYDKLDSLIPEIEVSESPLRRREAPIGSTMLATDAKGEYLLSVKTPKGWSMDINSKLVPLMKGNQPSQGLQSNSKNPIENEALLYDKFGNLTTHSQLTINGSLITTGDTTIGGDLTISGNDIKDDTGTTNITVGGGSSNNDVIIAGDLTVSGNNLTFGNGESILNVTDNTVGIITNADGNGILQAISAGTSTFQIKSTNDDSLISFLNGVTLYWANGFDYDDSYTLKWDYGNTIGSATRLSLNPDGDLLAKGTLTASTGLKLLYNDTNYSRITTAANGATTLATVDSDGTAGDLTLQPDGDIILDATANGTVTIKDSVPSASVPALKIDNDYDSTTASSFVFNKLRANPNTADEISQFLFYANTDNGVGVLTKRLYASIKSTVVSFNPLTWEGAIQFKVNGGSPGSTSRLALTILFDFLKPAVPLWMDGTAIRLESGMRLDFDANTSTGAEGHTYITEAADDSLQIVVGGDIMMQLTESGADGNHVQFRTDTSVGFQRVEETFSATGVIDSGGTDDTDIDFRFSNKHRLEMTGDINQMNLIFPASSGNFLLVCTTDGDHDVTDWKVWESDETAATTTDVMWAGGNVPAFTSSGIDIVSFYWDANEQQAYGTASLAFATP